MTQFRIGNFATIISTNTNVLIIGIVDTAIGPLLIVKNNDDISFVTSSSLKNYKTATGTKPTKKQQNYIKKIQDVLNVEFNGETIQEASVFISTFEENFKNTSKKADYDTFLQNSLDYYDLQD